MEGLLWADLVVEEEPGPAVEVPWKRESCQLCIQKWMGTSATEATAEACPGGSCGVRGGGTVEETVAVEVEELEGCLVICFRCLGDLGPGIEFTGVGACPVRLRMQVSVGTWGGGVELGWWKSRMKWLGGSSSFKFCSIISMKLKKKIVVKKKKWSFILSVIV